CRSSGETASRQLSTSAAAFLPRFTDALSLSSYNTTPAESFRPTLQPLEAADRTPSESRDRRARCSGVGVGACGEGAAAKPRPNLAGRSSFRLPPLPPQPSNQSDGGDPDGASFQEAH